MHLPVGRPRWSLATTLPYGARTFLGAVARDATAWPTHPPLKGTRPILSVPDTPWIHTSATLARRPKWCRDLSTYQVLDPGKTLDDETATASLEAYRTPLSGNIIPSQVSGKAGLAPFLRAWDQTLDPIRGITQICGRRRKGIAEMKLGTGRSGNRVSNESRTIARKHQKPCAV